MFTRQQAKEKLISFGIAEPTEEQITEFLNTVGAETKAATAKADKLKAENDRLQELADKAEELQREKEEIEKGQLSEKEQLEKELAKSNSRIAELEKAQSIAAERSLIVERYNVTGKQALEILKDDGTFDHDVLGQIIADKETAAAAAKEQELLQKTPNPDGKGSGGEEKSSAVRLVEKHFGKQTASTDIISHYVNGGK